MTEELFKFSHKGDSTVSRERPPVCQDTFAQEEGGGGGGVFFTIRLSLSDVQVRIRDNWEDIKFEIRPPRAWWRDIRTHFCDETIFASLIIYLTYSI